MSDFIDAYRASVITTLRCPKCSACNRPGATVIELDQTGSRAYCAVCACEGPLATFQPVKESA